MSEHDPVQHDPAAEDLDLLTVLEAQARIREEVRLSQERVAALEAAAAPAPELAAARSRLRALESTVERLANPTAPSPDPYPRRRPSAQG